jgi:cytochrome P450
MYSKLLIISFVSVSLYHLYQYVTLLLHRRTLVKKHACKPPPAYPQKDPLFGLDMCRDAINAIRSKTYLDRARRMYEQNGNTFSKYILGSPSIHTVEPENIKAILTNLKDFGITSGRKIAFLPLVGRRSILLSEGSHWETSRAFLRPVFVKGQVGDLVRLESHVAKLIRAIPRDGSTVDLGDLFFDLTANVTIDLMFGKPAKSAVKSSPADFAEAFHDVQVGCEERWRRGKLANVLPHAEFYRSVKKVHEFVDEHVLRAVEFHKAGKAQPAHGEKEERYILLQELGKLTDDVNLLRDELTTIFLAGRDTTASLLCNVFFMVARRPDIWRLVRNEVTPLDGKLPTLEQINQMSYIRFCINECKVFSPHYEPYIG